jgi:hypothetical protein
VSKTIKVLKATKGLNTKLDPTRIRYTMNTGVQELAVAVNVDIDDTGRLSRRKGFTRRLTGDYHSLFSHKETALCVTGDALSVLNADWTTTPIRNVTRGATVSYCPVDDKIYYVNGYEIGFVQNKRSYSWVQGPYVGPDTDRCFQDPPIGSLVRLYNGRIYIAQGDTLWYSEPFDYGRFDLLRNFIHFEGQISMVAPVTSGIFVGTDRNTHFLQGGNPAEGYSKIPVCNYPPIQYTDVAFQGKLVVDTEGNVELEPSADGECVLWMAKEGICFGGPQGNVVNLTKDKIVMPQALTGSSVVINEKFVGTLNP